MSALTHPVKTTGFLLCRRLQSLERCTHGLKRGIVAQPAGFAFEQANVMLPVEEGLAAIKAALVLCHLHDIDHGCDMVIVGPQADVTVSLPNGNAEAEKPQVFMWDAFGPAGEN